MALAAGHTSSSLPTLAKMSRPRVPAQQPLLTRRMQCNDVCCARNGRTRQGRVQPQELPQLASKHCRQCSIRTRPRNTALTVAATRSASPWLFRRSRPHCSAGCLQRYPARGGLQVNKTIYRGQHNPLTRLRFAERTCERMSATVHSGGPPHPVGIWRHR